MRANIFFFFFSSRRRHTRFSRDWSSDVCSSDLYAAGELDRIAQLELTGECAHGLIDVTFADEDRVPVASQLAEQRECAERVIDAVLWPHHAEVADQVRLSLLQLGLRRGGAEARKIGRAPDYEDVVGTLSSSGQRDRAVGLVGGDDDVGEAEGESFEHQGEP